LNEILKFNISTEEKHRTRRRRRKGFRFLSLSLKYKCMLACSSKKNTTTKNFDCCEHYQHLINIHILTNFFFSLSLFFYVRSTEKKKKIFFRHDVLSIVKRKDEERKIKEQE